MQDIPPMAWATRKPTDVRERGICSGLGSIVKLGKGVGGGERCTSESGCEGCSTVVERLRGNHVANGREQSPLFAHRHTDNLDVSRRGGWVWVNPLRRASDCRTLRE
jgi:hypothetical protein